MTTHKSKDDCATDVWVALELAQGKGKSLLELMAITGMTRNQVKAGLKEINHIRQLDKQQPIMVSPRDDWRYILPEYYRDLLPWTLNRVKDLLTRLRAEQTRIDAAALRWPDTVRPTIPRLIKRLVEDLEEVVVLVNGENGKDGPHTLEIID